MRNLLLNINDNSIVTPQDYKIDLQLFNCFVSALIENGVVGCNYELPIVNSENLFIKDIRLFDEWRSSYFKKQLQMLQPYVTAAISLIPIIVSLFKNININ